MATITVRATDSILQFVESTFVVTVDPLNTAPSFVKGPDQVLPINSPAQSIANWATNVSAGPPSDSFQTVAFEVTGNTNPGLFAVQPTVVFSGGSYKLNYQAATDIYGAATISVRARDNGGTVNGGVDVSPV
ncbi:hypothetical protein BH11PLA2_BH11PLA2_06890 [soil metagenome]